jgi:phosphopantothenoylcysteine decarboxylase/phosphopantothenate--cysteine ligase
MGKHEDANPLKDIRSSLGDELEGRRVVLCVTGSVASIEVPTLARGLMRRGADVNVVMSEAAERLVRPETLEWATGNPVVRKLTGETEHVRLAGEWEGRADLVLIAPCTANTISKIALGIDDTPVTTMASMALGGGIPLIVCPAAHEPMYRNPAVRTNVLSLEKRGVEFVGPRYEEEKAKMATVDEIVDAVVRRLSVQDLRGKKVLVSGGPTVEFIDPVRVITNLSSGKMGLALAKEAWRRGAEVFYVFGGSLYPPAQIMSTRVRTTGEMMKAVLEELGKSRYDVFISAAAPSDFAPVSSARKKLRTEGGRITLALKPTPKIIEEVRKRMPKIYLVAFKAETTGSAKELRSAIRRFKDKVGADMVVGNDVRGGKGFGTDTNSVVILRRGRTKASGERSKDRIARIVLDEAVADQRPRG